MKQLPFIFLCLLLLGSCNDASKRSFPSSNSESQARFPGGKEMLNAYLSYTLKYPEKAIEQEIEGKVFVSFSVEADGKVTRVHVIKSVHPLLDKEAKRVVETMPRWRPGRIKGKPVISWFNLPITFRLE